MPTTDIIQLLPDNIANQIAAGEVIQRPANVVKELVENAIDAHATKIVVHITDAGKTMIQVSDDGVGMSVTDARMCFEKHATSKIRFVDDIFHIRTMGFRGEALASIAAISQVTLKTKQHDAPVGTLVEIDNTLLTKQEPVMTADGTQITVKNLFYTVPARKNFLKGDPIEMKHIVDEFLRIAIPFYTISFELYHNNKPIYNLPQSTFKQRLIQIFGAKYNEQLISIEDTQPDLSFKGFIGKPEISKLGRGEQYIFVNRRFIKNHYLSHAITSVYQNLIGQDKYAFYVINIDIDPQLIDVNIHPTKQEIKFRNDKLIYTLLNGAVRYAFSKYALVPSIDFELAKTTQQFTSLQQPISQEAINRLRQSDIYKDFYEPKNIQETAQRLNQQWQPFYETIQPPSHSTDSQNDHNPQPLSFDVHVLKTYKWKEQAYYQFCKEYVITNYEEHMIMVHQQLAHQIILYEKYVQAVQGKQHIASRILLFPHVLDLTIEDGMILNEIVDDLAPLGYTFLRHSDKPIEVIAVPEGVEENDIESDINKFLESFKNMLPKTNFHINEKILRSLSLKNAIKSGKTLNQEEMKELVYQLFQCAHPLYAYGSLKSFIIIEKNTIDKLF